MAVIFFVSSGAKYIFCGAGKNVRGQGGIEPPTSPTLKENHTTRPLAQHETPVPPALYNFPGVFVARVSAVPSPGPFGCEWQCTRCTTSLWPNWIRRLTTNQEIGGSSPSRDIFLWPACFFFLRPRKKTRGQKVHPPRIELGISCV